MFRHLLQEVSIGVCLNLLHGVTAALEPLIRLAPLSNQPFLEPPEHTFDRDFVAKEVAQIISSFAQLPHLVVLDVSCGLDSNIRNRYNISFLDVFFRRSVHHNPVGGLDSEVFGRIQQKGASYLALDCQGFYRKSAPSETRFVIRIVGMPQEHLACLWLRGPLVESKDSEMAYYGTQTYTDIFVLFNKSTKPAYWSLYDLDTRRYLSLLRTYVFFGPKDLRATDPRTAVEALMRRRSVHRWEIRLCDRESFPKVAVLSFRDPTTKIHLDVDLKISRTEDELIGRYMTGVLRKSLVARARTPRITAPLLVAQAVLNPRMWILLVPTMLIVGAVLHVLLEYDSDISFHLFGSVWTCVVWPVRCFSVTVKTMCIIGTWTLGVQVISAVLKGQVVSVFQSLPESRIGEVSHCESVFGSGFGTVPLGVGVTAHTASADFLAQNFHYFLRGGVLCQTSDVFDAIQRELLWSFDSYEVTTKEPQYKVKSLSVTRFKFHNISDHLIIHEGPKPDHPPLLELRPAQLLNSLKIFRNKGRALVNFTDALLKFFQVPLSSTYYQKECDLFDSRRMDPISQFQSAGIINARCVERSELKEHPRGIMRLEDLASVFRTLAVGLAAAVCTFLTMILVRQCSPTCRVEDESVASRSVPRRSGPVVPRSSATRLTDPGKEPVNQHATLSDVISP